MCFAFRLSAENSENRTPLSLFVVYVDYLDRQEFVMEAPVSLVRVGDLDKMGNDDQRSREMVCVDAGICTQNICLFCSAAGLSTVPRASMNHKEIHRVLKLTNGQIPIMNTPVGYPKR
jgi:nitroreductase